MKKTILINLFVLLILSTGSLNSQDLDFRVGASYFGNTYTLENRTSTFNTIQPINDSLGVQTEFTQISIDSFIRESIIAYELGVGKQFDFKNRVSVRLGAGLNISFYHERRGFDFIDATVVLSDTVRLDDMTVPFSSLTCDEFLNSGEDFDINPNTRFSIVDFEISGEAKYWLLDNLVAIGGGMEIRTPVATERFRNFLTIDREEIDGINICEFIEVEDRDRSGDGFRNLKLGLDAFLEYKLQGKYGLQVGYNKQFSNTYAAHQFALSTFEVSEPVFRPGSFFARLSIIFGKKVSDTESSDL